MHSRVIFVILSVALSVLALPVSRPEAALDNVFSIAGLRRHIAPLIGIKEDKRGYRGTKNPRDQQQDDDGEAQADALSARGGFRGTGNGNRGLGSDVDLVARGGFRGTSNGRREATPGYRGVKNGRRDADLDARGGFRGTKNGRRNDDLDARGGFRGTGNH